MKRALILVILLLPAFSLAVWSAFPQLDPVFNVPLFHFYIVVFTTFAATVVSLFVVISAGGAALPRHFLLAIAFMWMGAVFFLHGVTTPNALISHFHPAITWSAWLTLFGGGAIFLVSAFAPNVPSPGLIRATAISILSLYLLYVVIAFGFPGALSDWMRLPITPTLADSLFGITVLVWLAGSARHYANYRQSQHFIDGLMAFEAGWFATATVSMFRFPLWNASWWLYHVILLAGFLIAIYALGRAYEQIRTFRLPRYYLAGGLIVTAALALVSAQVYGQLAFQNALDQLRGNTELISRALANELALRLPLAPTTADFASPQVGREIDQMLADLSQVRRVSVYDMNGQPVFTTGPAESADALHAHPPINGNKLAATLNGEATFEVFEPGLAPDGYAPTAAVYVLQTTAPFRPGGLSTAKPLGVLVMIREAPELTETLILSRRAGLGLAALSLGGLFMALSLIIYRADRLITSRSRELEQAYADLKRVEGLREDLTNMIIHDLRNPLTTVTANLDLIARTYQNPAYANTLPRFLANARTASKRMTGLIDDLLTVSKFEVGQLQPDLALVNIPNLLSDRAEAYRPQAEAEHKQLTVIAPPDLPAVMADAGLIGRTVDNLLSNALKYTDSGGDILIQVDREADLVRVSVSDNGEGIPAEYHARIFEKFVQVTDVNGLPLRKGTGLGLTFCRLAVEAHGGRIWVESALGAGSTFSFTLPLNGRAEKGATP
jgi:signal transduction histidine kinase